MKLNNLNVWLPEKFQAGGTLKRELGYHEVYNHAQAIVYYEKGISEFDSIFKLESYIKAGYLCTLMASENGFNIFFLRFKSEQVSDLGVAHINRKNILSFEEQESDNLEVVKTEAIKHKAKYMTHGLGLIGAATRLISDEFVSANTDLVKGAKFILKYKDLNDLEKSIILYSPEQNRHKVQLFLNTFYKSELPNEVINPPTVKSKSACYIATACYRDLYATEVILLRKFRDEILNKYFIGKVFIKVYYFTSPFIYPQLLRRPKLTKRLKVVIDKLVQLIK